MINSRECLQFVRSCLQIIAVALGELYDVLCINNRTAYRRLFYTEKPIKGFYALTFPDLKRDPEFFFKYYRMDVKTFDYLLYKMKPYFRIQRHRKDGINEEERLAITLRFLASGDEIFSLAVSHRCSESTIRHHIESTCKVIYEALSEPFLLPPDKVAWRNIAKGFKQCWNMPNCIGAVNGKHVSIIAPYNSGTIYRNYKKFFSIVLMAICNHRYEFTCVDVGAFGGESDGGIFRRSNIKKSMDDGSIDIPNETPYLPNSNIKIPYYFVGDEAFKMSKNMMRPYPGYKQPEDRRIFNYRLSRARRCIENSFGILVARWRVLNNRISFQPEIVKSIVIATVCLHNFIMSGTQKETREQYCPENFTDQVDENGDVTFGQWREEVPGRSTFLNEHTEETEEVDESTAIRETLKNYFMSPAGAVSWQKDIVNRGAQGESDSENDSENEYL